MTIQLEWHMNKRAAYVVLSGLPDMDLIRAAEKDLIRVMDDSSQSVHSILDLRTLEQFPPLIDCIRSPYIRHERKGWIIIIGLTEKPLFRVLVNSLITGLRLSARTADSLDEALQILLQHDPSLP